MTLLSSCAGCASSMKSDMQRRMLLETDQSWAAAARAGDVERIKSFWADDAVNFFPGAPVAKGKEALGKLLRRNRTKPGFSLTWSPVKAEVAQSGELGYTYGNFQLSRADDKGEPITRAGNYVCIWEKQSESGKWKCVVESTIFGP